MIRKLNLEKGMIYFIDGRYFIIGFVKPKKVRGIFLRKTLESTEDFVWEDLDREAFEEFRRIKGEELLGVLKNNVTLLRGRRATLNVHIGVFNKGIEIMEKENRKNKVVSLV